MGHYGALPPAFARVSPRFFTPGFATIVSAIVASAFYAVMRVVSENTLWDTILTLGMMICFYYGITAFACVWYFRRQWFDSVRNVFFTFLFPLVGGVILASCSSRRSSTPWNPSTAPAPTSAASGSSSSSACSSSWWVSPS
jgi:amino acid transporter